MKKIQLTPKDFSFPNFCFEKRYENYLFLDSAILATSQEAEKYFFEILKELEKCGKQNNKSWNLLIPVTIQSEYRNFNLRGCSLSQSVIQLGTHAAVWSPDQRLEMAS